MAPWSMLSLCPLRALLVAAAQHPDAAARTLCALVSSSHLVFARSNLFCDLPFILTFPALVFCVYGGICSSPPARLYDVGPPCRPRAHRAKETLNKKAVSPHCAPQATSRIRGWARTTSGGASATGRAYAHPRLPRPLRLRGGSSSAATGTPRILISTTSATQRKKVVRKGRREREQSKGVSGLSSTAVLCAPHAHRAEETLDESVTGPPAVQELECDREMGIGMGIADRRTDGADNGYARAWTGGDGEKERERGKGKQYGGGRGSAACAGRGGGSSVRMKGDTARARRVSRRMLGVIELEPHHCSVSLGSFEAVAGRVLLGLFAPERLVERRNAFCTSPSCSMVAYAECTSRARVAPMLSLLELEPVACARMWVRVRCPVVGTSEYSASMQKEYDFFRARLERAPRWWRQRQERPGLDRAVLCFLSSAPGLPPNFRRLSVEFSFRLPLGKSPSGRFTGGVNEVEPKLRPTTICQLIQIVGPRVESRMHLDPQFSEEGKGAASAANKKGIQE
ncbi:hypothetical protein B0H13DRAFT_2452743 [Mycena leptocephala]|nr:hypothetical protein B0H13DRAFT_2452743 [Mycena leptocephala]